VFIVFDRFLFIGVLSKFIIFYRVFVS